MARLTATTGTLSCLLAIPSCSLLVDTHPDGVRDAGSGASSGEAGAKAGGANSVPAPGWAGASMSAGAGAGSGGTPLVGSTWSDGGLGGMGSSSAASSAGAFSAGASHTEVVFPAGGAGGQLFSVAGNANVAGTTAGGAHALACGAGETPCVGTCVNTKLDKANCGACGTPCEGYQFCANGKCLPTYVSTRVQPGDASVVSAAVTKDKAQGDLLLQLLAGEAGITVSSLSAVQQRAANDVAFAKYTAEGIFIWGRTMRGLFPPDC